MTLPTFSMTRRSALRQGLVGLSAVALAQPALATPGVTYPLRIAYARVAPTGFVQIRSDEQDAWTRMATRLGGLISALAPLQPGGIVGGLPRNDGSSDYSLVARQMAEDAGYNQVILYATLDGQRVHGTYDNWFSQTFNNLLASIEKDGRATGEAQLMLTNGGIPLATASADAAPRDLLNLFDGRRNPEREVLGQLIGAMERQLQDMARSAYESSRSIGD